MNFLIYIFSYIYKILIQRFSDIFWIFNSLAILDNLRNIIKFGILYIDNRSHTISKHLYIISVLSEVLFVVINFACSKLICYTISELFVKVFILQSIFFIQFMQEPVMILYPGLGAEFQISLCHFLGWNIMVYIRIQVLIKIIKFII